MSRLRRQKFSNGAGVSVSLVVLLGAGALAVPASSAAASSTRSPSSSAPTGGSATALVRIGTAVRVPTGDRATGRLAPRRTLDFGVALTPRDAAGLSAYAVEVSTPGSAEYHRYLTPAMFAARFGPSAKQIARVETAMRRSGLRVGTLASNHLLLGLSGSVSTVEHAFHTSVVGYALAGGSTGWATSSTPRLERTAASGIQSILGLDNLVSPSSQLRRAPAVTASTVARADAKGVTAHVTPSAAGAPTGCDAAIKDALIGGGWTDSQIAQAYGLDGLYARGDVGAGQTIALFELEPFLSSDVATFDRCYFGASHASQLQTVPVDGFNLVGPGSGEAILDIDDLTTLAPAAKILVYEAPNTTFGGIDEYNAIVSQDRANIVSTSWGECESALETAAPGSQQLENVIFEEAAAQGQTVISAAGDTGSDDCAGTQFGNSTAVQPYLSADDPASQPYVLAAGGTSLQSDTDPPSQTVWNHGSDWGGGGGGFSLTWPMPSWQQSSDVPGIATIGNRELPDVSASADEWRGVTVYSQGFIPSSGSALPNASPVPPGWTTIGGTSSAAPTWAAVLADIAASGGACSTLPTTAGGPDLGFVSPELYAIASNPSAYAQSFSDITTGTNDVFGLGLGYAATLGFDPASGLGTPLVTSAAGSGGLDASLCAEASAAAAGSGPTVSSVTPGSGPTSGGGVVTIAGSNFPTSTSDVHVSFGAASATVDLVTSTSITVTPPQSDIAANSPSVEAAGRVDVIVTVSSGSTSVSNRQSSASTYEYVDESTSTTSTTAPSTTTPNTTVPSVSGVGPEAGNSAGGNTVTIYGTGFSAAGTPSVTFGGVAASSVVVVSDSELSVTVPAESGSTACSTGAGFVPSSTCQVEVVVSNSNGSSATVPILPALSGAIVFNPQGIVVPTPETEVAPVATEYDYAPTPVITSITPDLADSSGSTPVTISGSGFNLNTFEWVNFGPPTDGTSEQVQISSITPTQITIDPPAGIGNSAGKRSALKGGVSVQSAGGLSNIENFGYSGIPAVRRLSAFGGASTGGTLITIHGSGLADVTSVAFASEVSADGYGASKSFIVSGATADKLTVVAPADLPGPVDVEPCTTTGCAKANPKTDTFVYFSPGRPSLDLVTPRKGPAKGGTEIFMYGDNLDGAVGVRFGANSTDYLGSTTDYPDGDPYILAALAPPGIAGSTVPITVLTRTGRSHALSAGTFHYLASAPAAPRSLHVVVHGTKASVRWVAPVSDGGSPVTSYSVVALAAGSGPTGGVFPSTKRSVTVTGLLADHTYVFRVAAYNAPHGRGNWAFYGPVTIGFTANGYRVVTAAGVVTGIGSLDALGGVAGSLGASHVIGIASTSDGNGYWVASSNGTVTAFGDAPTGPYAHATTSPVVGFAAMPTPDGYWEVTASGQVFSWGKAKRYKPINGGKKLPSPAVGIASTPDGLGYYVVTAAGQVYTAGDATFNGTAVGRTGGPVTAIAANLDGEGYWILTATGKVYGFGTVGFGSPTLSPSAGTATAIASTPDGLGYWVLSSTGTISAFGDAVNAGSAPPSSSNYVGIATT